MSPGDDRKGSPTEGKEYITSAFHKEPEIHTLHPRIRSVFTPVTDAQVYTRRMVERRLNKQTAVDSVLATFLTSVTRHPT